MLTTLGSLSAFSANDPALYDTRDRWWEDKLMTSQVMCTELPRRLSVSPTDRRSIHQEEKELVARILKGDTVADRWFVYRFENLFRHLLKEMHLSTQEQEDLFQQVFLRLLEDRCSRLRQWCGEGRGGLVCYLRSIVKRQIFDVLRRRALPAVSCSPVEEEEISSRFTFLNTPVEPETAAIARVQKRAVQTAIYSLLRHDTELIRRRYYLGQSYRQIAAAMELAVNHVETALARAVERLQFKLEERYPGLFLEGVCPPNSQ